MPVERIFVTGGSGSGNSTLARRIGELTALPVHDLDVVAREGGGRGVQTSDALRTEQVSQILESGRWVVEGVHLGWTQPLLEAADVVVWLDHLSGKQSGGRVLRRFLTGALAEARMRHGRERFLRFGDYVRRLRELFVSLPDTRSFPEQDLVKQLDGISANIVRCRSQADIERFLKTLQPA